MADAQVVRAFVDRAKTAVRRVVVGYALRAFRAMVRITYVTGPVLAASRWAPPFA